MGVTLDNGLKLDAQLAKVKSILSQHHPDIFSAFQLVQNEAAHLFTATKK